MLPRKKGEIRPLSRKTTMFTIVATGKGVVSKRLLHGDVLKTLNTKLKIKFR